MAPARGALAQRIRPLCVLATLGVDRDFFLAHADEIERRVRAAARGGTLNILALSGGGAAASEILAPRPHVQLESPGAAMLRAGVLTCLWADSGYSYMSLVEDVGGGLDGPGAPGEHAYNPIGTRSRRIRLIFEPSTG